VAFYPEINNLIWQPGLSTRIEIKGLFRALANQPSTLPKPAAIAFFALDTHCGPMLRELKNTTFVPKEKRARRHKRDSKAETAMGVTPRAPDVKRATDESRREADARIVETL
jgi:hypothetical protein